MLCILVESSVKEYDLTSIYNNRWKGSYSKKDTIKNDTYIVLLS